MACSRAKDHLIQCINRNHSPRRLKRMKLSNKLHTQRDPWPSAEMGSRWSAGAEGGVYLEAISALGHTGAEVCFRSPHPKTPLTSILYLQNENFSGTTKHRRKSLISPISPPAPQKFGPPLS